MKYLVMSDSHGQIKERAKLLSLINKVDKVIHLGDHAKDLETFDLVLKPTFIVSGNCDEKGRFLEEITIEDESFKLFITHGHRYDVKQGLTKLYYKAQELGANIILFGHTHIPLCVENNGVYFYNPGSISLPKGGSQPSCGILTLKANTFSAEQHIL